ncbi:transcriptional regulator [Lacticaseibacillus chiayiensis]|uniref:Transcriptional regulator n=1 Tax=Lacticaseibacillus chiayiensis TaxID=2100821 RepID=A0A4V1NZX0_9LACO|nr:helix-turn-helix transcriptional regulator [Lacticaseibacillus chiayiensis]QVI33843.1 helix-turn-helix transcriptional regulator [Lacticaseibacillus chiayiensis]RXT18490.1 transcriptional regulator [Lacticaseibacillus chiayiensis]
MPLQEKIAKRIHELRLSKAMTQEQLAEKANMDVSMLARIERGSRGDIRMGTLDRIINGLDVAYQEFFTFGEKENPATQLASSIALIQDPDVIAALQKIVNSILKTPSQH